MDEERFDRFTVALTEENGTRRRLLGGVAGGGLAALAAGLVGAGAPDAAAKKGKNGKDRDKKKIKRLRRRLRRRRRNNENNAAPINPPNITNILQLGDSLGGIELDTVLEILGLDTQQDLIDLLTEEGVVTNVVGLVTTLVGGGGLTCDAASRIIPSLCDSGFCDEASNECAGCPNDQVCDDDDGLVCCVEGAVCANLGCVLD